MTNILTNLHAELHQMTLASRLYYEEGRTQQEIAEVMNISRPTVSRLLVRAREENIVNITITDPFETKTALADQFRQVTGLEKTIITQAIPKGEVLNLKILGISAARYLENELMPGAIVGVGWGRTLLSVVESLGQPIVADLTFVPLTGGLGQISPSFQVNELIRCMAEKFNANWRQFYLPAIVQDDDARNNLLSTGDVKNVTNTWETMNTAVVGIGNVSFDTELNMLFAKYLDQSTRDRLHAAGAVGDICMRFFDGDGRSIEDGLRGVIGIDLEKLHRISNVIGVASGASKAKAILGAIRGGLIKTLITDDVTARAILTLF